MSIIIFFILWSVTITECVCVFEQVVFQDVEELEGYNITSSVLENISRYKRMSRTACGIQCSTLGNCLSFFYNSITNYCQFHTEVFRSNSGASVQPGTVYFYLLGIGSSAAATGSVTTTGAPSHCPTEDGFQILGSNPDAMCIKFHTDEKTWSEANAICTNYSSNGHLGVMDTEVKDNLVRNAGIAINSEFNARVFIGMTAEGWIDGSPLVYTNWKSGSLVLGTGECAAYDRMNAWVWIAIECSRAKNYVCQIPV